MVERLEQGVIVRIAEAGLEPNGHVRQNVAASMKGGLRSAHELQTRRKPVLVFRQSCGS